MSKRRGSKNVVNSDVPPEPEVESVVQPPPARPPRRGSRLETPPTKLRLVPLFGSAPVGDVYTVRQGTVRATFHVDRWRSALGIGLWHGEARCLDLVFGVQYWEIDVGPSHAQLLAGYQQPEWGGGIEVDPEFLSVLRVVIRPRLLVVNYLGEYSKHFPRGYVGSPDRRPEPS